MKILHITQSYGGVATYILQIAEQLKDVQDFEFCLITSGESDLSRRVQRLGWEVYFVPMKRDVSPLRDAVALYKIANIIRKTRPTLVHCHSSKAGVLGRIAAKMMSVPTCYTANAFAFLGYRGIKRFFFRLIESIMVRFTDMLLPVSKSEMRRAMEIGFDKGSVHLLSNSIAPVYVAPQDRKDENILIVFMNGRLCYQKNPQMFVTVAAKVIEKKNNVRFILQGPGYLDEMKDEIQKMISDLSLHEKLQLVSWGSRERTLELLGSCDIYCLTSRFEGLPLTLLEAQWLSKPIVATNVDGNRDVIKDGYNGYLVPEGDSDAMTEKILLLLDDNNLARTLGANGRRYVESEFNIIEFKKKLVEVYRLFA